MTSAARILVVDDDEWLRMTLRTMLDVNGLESEGAGSVQEALRVASEEPFDVALVDLTLGDGSGLDLIHALVESTIDIAVVVVTGHDDRETAARAFEAGALGYIIKPFKQNDILINIGNAMRLRSLEIDRRADLVRLERSVLDHRQALLRSERTLADAGDEIARIIRGARDDMIQQLVRVLEYRDLETSRHTERMSRYAEVLARRLGFPDHRCDEIRVACALHDIGKVGIPDAILLKASYLTDEERAVVRTHADIGHRILTGMGSTPIPVAATVALTHHERWDGTGYPRGLRGAEIPMEGRIAAISDVFDALTSSRRWRPAFDVDYALELMRAERGAQLDPEGLDLFLEALDEVEVVRDLWSDPSSAA